MPDVLTAQVLQAADRFVTAGDRAFVAPELLAAVDRVVNSRYGVPDWKADSALVDRLARAYDTIRHRFTPERYSGDVPYMWAAYYLAQNTCKAQVVLSHTLQCMRQIPRDFYVLDLGAGIGPTTWATAAHLRLVARLCGLHGLDRPCDRVTVRSFEASADSIRVYDEIREAFLPAADTVLTVDPPRKIRIPQRGWETALPADKPSLVFFSNLLGELGPRNQPYEVVRQCLAHVHPSSVLCLIEPANQGRCRALRAIQTRLVSELGLSVWGPCGLLHRGGKACTLGRECWSYSRHDLGQPTGMLHLERALVRLFPRKYRNLTPHSFENARWRWSWAVLAPEPSARTFDLAYFHSGPVRSLGGFLSGPEGETPVLAQVVGVLDTPHSPSQVTTYKLCDQSTDTLVELDPGTASRDPHLQAGDVILLHRPVRRGPHRLGLAAESSCQVLR